MAFYGGDRGDYMQPMQPSWKHHRPPPKTSSERGRKFRARQREYEVAIERQVEALRDEIQALTASKSLFCERLLRTQSAQEGSIHRRIREFFTLFQDGLEARVDVSRGGGARLERKADRVLVKESYMRSVFDPDTITGDSYGVHTVIDQWRRYTVFHGRFHLNLGHIDVVGPADDREFRLHVKLKVRVTRNTFEHVFPVALSDEALVQKLLNREIEYDCVVRMRFSDDGRITSYFLDVDFIGGLRRVCENLDDVAKLLNQSKITPACMLRDSMIDRPAVDRPADHVPLIDVPATINHRDEHQRLLRGDDTVRDHRYTQEPHIVDDRKARLGSRSPSHDARSPNIVTPVKYDQPIWRSYDLSDRLVKPTPTTASTGRDGAP